MKRSLSLVGLATLLSAGCIHTHETVVKDESRTAVEFENDAAARIFYETLTRGNKLRDRTESQVEVSLPIVFSHERKVVRGTNAGFNEAVSECDTNHDHRITEAEARIYSEKPN